MPFNYKQEYNRYRRYYQSLEPVLKKPTGRAYTSIIFSFLAISLFGWYAIRPTMQTIFTLKRQIADDIEVDKKLEDKISALIDAQEVFQEVEPNIPLINQALPSSPDVAPALAQIRSLSEETGVTFVGITAPQLPLIIDAPPNKPASKLTDYNITVSAIGSYTDIQDFLTGLVNLRRIIQIESMTFAPKRGSSIIASESATPTGAGVQVDLKLKLFYLGT